MDRSGTRYPLGLKSRSTSITKIGCYWACGMVYQQAAKMGYVDVFFLLAIMFAACLPLILIMKKAPKGGGGPGAMAH